MNTSTFPTWSDSPPPTEAARPWPLRRFFGVVARPQSYRNITYLLLGLPFATLWFGVLVTLASVSVSMLVVALLGIPLLVGTWYAVRAFANVERCRQRAARATSRPSADRGRRERQPVGTAT